MGLILAGEPNCDKTDWELSGVCSAKISWPILDASMQLNSPMMGDNG